MKKNKVKKHVFLDVFKCLMVFLISCNNGQDQQTLGAAVESDKLQLLAPGIICTGDYETHAAFSPTGDTLYFLKCMPDLTTCAICVSYKSDNNSWTDPEIVPFSGRYLDVDPFVTKDGNTIYFVSNRPVHGSDSVNSSWDIWKVNKKDNKWDNPVHLDSAINSSQDEYYPTLADNGNLYFGSSRNNGKGGSDIYCAERVNGITTIENLGDSINTNNNEYEAFISPDESYLIYMSTRPNGLINADFYVSVRKKGNWTKAGKLPVPLNSSATEWAPKVTRDTKYFYFGSTRNRSAELPIKEENLQEFKRRLNKPGNGLGDIYFINDSLLSLDQYKK